MAHADIVHFNGGFAELDIFALGIPALIGEHHVGVRICLHPVIRFLMGKDFSAGIPEYLATAAVVPVIVAVE